MFAFMWLVSSAAWAKGLSDVKTATNPDKVITLITACEAEEKNCREVHDPVMSGLNTSVVRPSLSPMPQQVWAVWVQDKTTCQNLDRLLLDSSGDT